MTSAPSDTKIPDAPTAEVQSLRREFPDMAISVELWDLAWVFVARGRNGGDPWLLASDSVTRFRNAVAGKGFQG